MLMAIVAFISRLFHSLQLSFGAALLVESRDCLRGMKLEHVE
jgi:hypothetical protein